MKKRKIVVNYIAIRGGGIFYSLAMVKELCAMGNEVLGVVSSEMENLELWKTIPGLQLLIVKGYSTKWNFIPRLFCFLCSTGPRLRKRIRCEGYEFVYIPMSSFWTIPVGFFLHDLKNIYTQHDPIPHDAKSPIARISKKCAEKADAIIVLSDLFVDAMRQTYKKPIFSIPLGPVAQLMQKVSNKKNPSYSKMHNFLFQGKILDYKGLDVLADAYRKLSAEFSDVTLTIAGSGDFSQYKDMYASLPHVRIENRWIKDEELSDFFAIPEVVTIVPYKTATQSGVIPLAMQNHSFVIASDCGGLREQIENNVTGILVPPSDSDALCVAMKQAILHPEDVKRMTENAFARMNQYSWANAGQKLEQIMDYLSNKG